MTQIIAAIVFFLPAGLANGTPPIAAKIPVLKKFNAPMDFNKSFRGKRIFGPNKTWRGFITGVLVATIAALLISKFVFKLDEGSDLSVNVLAGTLMGVGALLGDAFESFLKRQFNKEPGKSWFPFDQIDYIVGGLLFVAPLAHLTLRQYVLVGIVWFGLHIAGSSFGYLIGVKDKAI